MTTKPLFPFVGKSSRSFANSFSVTGCRDGNFFAPATGNLCDRHGVVFCKSLIPKECAGALLQKQARLLPTFQSVIARSVSDKAIQRFAAELLSATLRSLLKAGRNETKLVGSADPARVGWDGVKRNPSIGNVGNECWDSTAFHQSLRAMMSIVPWALVALVVLHVAFLSVLFLA